VLTRLIPLLLDSFFEWDILNLVLLLIYKSLFTMYMTPTAFISSSSASVEL